MDSRRRLTLFVSDLHLEADRPEVTGLFGEFMRHYGARASALYILGDFFEAWIGDDDESPLCRQVAGELRSLSDQGVPVYLMVGNRDFLIGDRFAASTGCRLLPDPTLIDLHGIPTLLMHGDSLCIDDREYQSFRSEVRSAAWQREFLSQPLEARAAIARDLRETSRRRSRNKPQAIMDVNQQEVERVMRSHNVSQLIHGHTHRPAMHRFRLGKNDVKRWVLGDWTDTAMVLVCDAHGTHLVEFGSNPARTSGDGAAAPGQHSTAFDADQ